VAGLQPDLPRRFSLDLAPALGRNSAGAFDARAVLFEAMALDPALAGVKWIAEPWDVPPRGMPSGYRLGRFPAGWAEWNDRFRDAGRRFWRGDTSGAAAAELATRLSGSEDIFGARAPLASINFVAAHDGFTLADLASYDHKHNLGNGESNRDGSDQNLSRNWGVEGPTDDPSILARRALHRRNLLMTLFLAQGVPMLGHGDELGRSQAGNNNAYCLDDETTWIDWTRADGDLLAWTRRLTAIRRCFPQLRREAPVVVFALAPGPIDAAGEGLLLLVNGSGQDQSYTLPLRHRLLCDSAQPALEEEADFETLGHRTVTALSQVLLAYRDPLA